MVWTVGFESQKEQEIIYSSKTIETESGDHPTSSILWVMRLFTGEGGVARV
jgi:hypothetical protein